MQLRLVGTERLIRHDCQSSRFILEHLRSVALILPFSLFIWISCDLCHLCLPVISCILPCIHLHDSFGISLIYDSVSIIHTRI